MTDTHPPSGDSQTAPIDKIALVTGSNGFLGVRVVSALLEQGFKKIRCFVRPTSNLERLKATIAHANGSSRVEIITGDLSFFADCQSAVDGVDLVLHLAAGFDRSQTNVERDSVNATRCLLEACAAAGRIRRFVLVSSFAVYSNATLPRRALLDESSPLETQPEKRHDAYTLGKIRQEELVRRYSRERKLPCVILRPGTIFGPGKREITGRVGLRVSKLFLNVGGRNPLPLTYVDNCAEAVVLAGLQLGVEGETFNIVDDDLPTCDEFLQVWRRVERGCIAIPVPYWAAFCGCALIETLSRLIPRLPRRFNRARARAEWKGNHYSNAHARLRLGWTPRVPMTRALELFLSQFEPHQQ